MSNIENLLRRQYEGVITPEEQSELDRLTHRDNVIMAATRRAKVLRRRQIAGVTGAASVLLVAGLIFFNHPSIGEMKADGQLMAKSEIPEMSAPIVVVTEQAHTKTQAKSTNGGTNDVVHNRAELISEPSVVVHEATSVVASAVEQPTFEEASNDVQPAVITESEPIVACNTACSPDSVISDIWKFLRT